MLGSQILKHSFLYMTECSIPLLEWDLLYKLNAQITFSPGQLDIQVPPEHSLRLQMSLLALWESDTELLPPDLYDQVRPEVWADRHPGKAKNTVPVESPLKHVKAKLNLKQYLLKQEAQKGIQPILKRFLLAGHIWLCQLPYNTPILSVNKPNSDECRLVQDLRAINEMVQDLHPVVPNPYTLLTNVSGHYECLLSWILRMPFSVFLWLKKPSYCLPLNGKTQTLRAHNNIVGLHSFKVLKIPRYIWGIISKRLKRAQIR